MKTSSTPSLTLLPRYKPQIKLYLSPSPSGSSICLNLGIYLELRNNIAHNNSESEVNLNNSLRARFRERTVVEESVENQRQTNPSQWQCSSTFSIRLNVDAVVAKEFTSLVVVARNEHGSVLKAWVCIVIHNLQKAPL